MNVEIEGSGPAFSEREYFDTYLASPTMKRRPFEQIKAVGANIALFIFAGEFVP